MGLKSSLYHLKKFIDLVFSEKVYAQQIVKLINSERDLFPGSLEKIISSYFDDCFVFADNYEQLYACFKLCMMAARDAKIKFSIEKATFFTTKIKILGY